MAIRSIEEDAEIKNLKFYKDYCFKGGSRRKFDLKKVKFTYHIDDLDISKNLINQRERKITFKCTLERDELLFS